MAHKAWIIKGQDGTIVDLVNARKKIAFVDAYLCDLYAQSFDDAHDDLASFLTHPSGQEVVLEKDGNNLRAQLGEVDHATWAHFRHADTQDW